MGWLQPHPTSPSKGEETLTKLDFYAILTRSLELSFGIIVILNRVKDSVLLLFWLIMGGKPKQLNVR